MFQNLDLWLRSVWTLWDTHGTRLLGAIGTAFSGISAIAVAVLEPSSKVCAGLLAVSTFISTLTHARGVTNASPPNPSTDGGISRAAPVIFLGLLLLAMVSNQARAADARYLEWSITKRAGAANSVQVAEFQLMQGGAPLSISGATASGDGQSPSNEGPALAIDGGDWTKWLQFTTATGTAVSVKYSLDLRAVKSFDGYRLMTANDEPTRDPVSWTLRGSPDNVTWVVLAQVSDFSPPAARKAWTTAFSAAPPPPLPAGVVKVADLGGTFTASGRMDVKLCKADFTGCSDATAFFPNNGGAVLCRAAMFHPRTEVAVPASKIPASMAGIAFVDVVEAPTGSACFSVPVVVPPPSPPPVVQEPCYPADDVQVLTWFPFTYSSKNWSFVTVPSGINSTAPYLALFKDTCGGKHDYQYFSMGEVAGVVQAKLEGKMKDSAGMNTWRKAQPVSKLTAEMVTYGRATAAALDSAPPKYVVSKSGLAATATTRPSYPVKSGVRGTTKNGDVTIGDPCSETVNLGSGWMGVGGLTDPKTGKVIAAGSVALCAKL